MKEGRRGGSASILGVVKDILTLKHADQVAMQTYLPGDGTVSLPRELETVYVCCRVN